MHDDGTRSPGAWTGSHGWWRGDLGPDAGVPALRAALADIGAPAHLVRAGEETAVASSGTTGVGSGPDGSLPLLASVPPVHPESLGDPAFRAEYGVRYAYVAGAMANGISSEELVEAMARAGMLAFFGAAGRSLTRVEQAVERLQGSVGDLPHGFNLIHSPAEPELEAAIVDLYLRREVRTVSASAYLDLTLPVVRYRTAGIHRDEDGRVVVPNRILAKVSRVETARKFLAPPPARFLDRLVADGALTAEQAALAAEIPMADDITAEADSGGHTDNRPLVVLLPRLQALRDELQAEHGYARPPRVGAAGGIGTPDAVAAAFSLGAAYVVTGSINQAAVESGSSDRVRAMLAAAGPTDVTMAPAADMFEMGVEVQVLGRGTMFAVRARRLHDLYRRHDSLDALGEDDRRFVEETCLRASLGDAWTECASFWQTRDPAQAARAEADPHHKMALLFRMYLGLSSRWANAGEADRSMDYQVWCGPAMGAFNAWAAGTRFEAPEGRRVAAIARNLLVGAAILARAGALRAQGATVARQATRFSGLPDATLDRLLEAPAPPPAPTPEPRLEVVGDRDPTRTPVAIVGMAGMFPGASDLASFWRNLRTGFDAIGPIPETHWSLDDYHDPDPKAPDRTYARRGGFLEPVAFDPTEFGIPPTILEATDTSQLLGLWVAARALEDAGYGANVAWDRSRASVILGVTGTQELVISLGARLGHPHWRRALDEAGVDGETAADVVDRISRAYVGWQENSFPGLLGNVVAGRIANRLDLGGTNCVIDAACASSLGALEMGVMQLRSHRSDLVLAGGVDTLNDIFMHMCFSKTPALSPTGDVRPFAAGGDGTVLGEAIGILVLKRLEDAERAGDRIRAVLTGIGSAGDGRAKSIYAPLEDGQERALRAAYRDAGIAPADVHLVEGHGTGTRAGDACELRALRAVYEGAEPGSVALGSVKSMIGHTKAAAGAAGLMKVALALENKVLPPTLKVDEPNPALEDGAPFHLPTRARPWVAPGEGKRRAAVSSFGFGGSNFHAVLEEYRPTRPAPSWDGAVELFATSASDRAAVAVALREAGGAVEAEDVATFLADARARFDASAAHRAVVVLPAADPADRGRRLEAAAHRIEAAPGAFESPSGVAYGVGPVTGGTAFLFPGQGAQYAGMLGELACVFPEVSEALDDAPEVAAWIHPAPAAGADVGDADARLQATERAQPALGVVERGALALLRSFGIDADAVAGHSYGELAALYAAGALDASALDRASRARGDALAAAADAGGGGDRGSMLAVLAPVADVERLLVEENLELVLANRNGPSQSVLSGATSAVEAAEEACAARGLRAVRPSVGAAFHSPLVAEAEERFAAALADIDVRVPRIPVIANTTAEPYPGSAPAVADVLARQPVEPVRWVQSVEALYAAGMRTFVEVGPRATLTGLTGRILGDRPHLAVALDASSGRGSGLQDFAVLVARLAAAGLPVRLDRWQRGVPPRRPAPVRRRRMNVPLSGVNHRNPQPPKPRRAPASPPPVARPRPEVPMSSSSRPPVSHDLLAQALAANEEHLRALQAMQEQTAALHRTFLEGQLAAQASFQSLLAGRQRIVEQSLGMPLSPAPAPIAAPPPGPSPVAQAAPPTPYTPPAYVAPPPVVMPAAPAAPVAPVAVPAPASVVAAPSTPVVSTVDSLLAVVAEATGYPVDMLELDMDLESDLGIDSIKRVEILSLLSERLPHAPVVEPENLGGLRTLRAVADFVGESPAPAAATAAPVVPAPRVAAAPRAPAVPVVDPHAALLAVVAESTGYPEDMLELDMDLESDLGIDSIKRVEILSLLSERLPHAPVVEPEQLGGLRTLREVLDFVAGGTRPDTDVERVETAVRSLSRPPSAASETPWRGASRPEIRTVTATAAPPPATTAAASPEGGRVLLFDTGDLAGPLAEAFADRGVEATSVDLDAPDDVWAGAGGLVVSGSSLPGVFAALRAAGPTLQSRPGAFLVSVARGDGAFGLRSGALGPAGGLAGLVKSADREWSGVTCRALDVGDADPALVAARVIDELGRPGPVERGVGGERLLLRTPLDAAGDIDWSTSSSRVRARLGDGCVVVTGGARGVTADCAVALADAGVGGLLLLGRSPAPGPEEAWLADAHTDAEIKRALLAHGSFGGRPTPRELGRAAARVAADREIRGTLARIDAVGGHARYRSVDARDADAVAAAVTEARQEFGAVRGVVHGAGVLRDKLIVDKSDADFALVLGTKVEALDALLAATADDELRLIALFSSVSGRFGRKGQSDYAAANQVLDAVAASESSARPGCRVVSFAWGPWDGGMVTPALKREFEREGVALLSRGSGARVFVDECGAAPGSRPVHLVVGSGLDEGAPGLRGVTDPVDSPVVVGPETDPYLTDHRLDGLPVLPLAMSMELLAAAAVDAVGGELHGLDDVRVLRGVVFGPGAPALVTRVGTTRPDGDDGALRAPVELRSVEGVVHVRAVARLGHADSSALRPTLTPLTQPRVEPWSGTPAQAYATDLFHGPSLHCITAIEGSGPEGMVLRLGATPPVGVWRPGTTAEAWTTSPLPVDGVFQALILWCRRHHGAPSLPSRVTAYHQLAAFPSSDLTAVIRVRKASSRSVLSDVDLVAEDGTLVARLEGFACTVSAKLDRAFGRGRSEPEAPVGV